MITFLRERPWIWIVFAFVILISSWVVLFKIAGKYRPEPIEIQTVESHER